MDVVVGLDTSAAAAEALRWAARYARAVGADLHAVHAYLWRDRDAVLLPTDPNMVDTSGKLLHPVLPPEEISHLFASVQPEPGWTLKCFAGDPGPVLRSQAKDAGLLVVGTGEHGLIPCFRTVVFVVLRRVGADLVEHRFGVGWGGVVEPGVEPGSIVEDLDVFGNGPASFRPSRKCGAVDELVLQRGKE